MKTPITATTFRGILNVLRASTVNPARGRGTWYRFAASHTGSLSVSVPDSIPQVDPPPTTFPPFQPLRRVADLTSSPQLNYTQALLIMKNNGFGDHKTFCAFDKVIKELLSVSNRSDEENRILVHSLYYAAKSGDFFSKDDVSAHYIQMAKQSIEHAEPAIREKICELDMQLMATFSTQDYNKSPDSALYKARRLHQEYEEATGSDKIKLAKEAIEGYEEHLKRLDSRAWSHLGSENTKEERAESINCIETLSSEIKSNDTEKHFPVSFKK